MDNKKPVSLNDKLIDNLYAIEDSIENFIESNMDSSLWSILWAESLQSSLLKMRVDVDQKLEEDLNG